MKAARLYKNESLLRIEDVPVPEVGNNKILVRIKCCGVCGSDIHATVHKQVSLKNTPVTMGHESSGIVEETGEGVSSFRKGDRVVISAGTSCGVCRFCVSGRENYCEKKGVLGFDSDGAFAEFILTEERYLTRLPDSIPFDEGAILADAVSTPYHALKYQGRLEAGESVAVIGCGGLGVHAVVLAKALGAGKVTAVDIDDGALEHAEKYGADVLINAKTSRNLGKTIREVSGGIDVFCDFSGYYKNIEDSVRTMNSGGRMVMVGIGKHSLNIGFAMNLVDRQICITGSLGCDKRAIPELISLHEEGRLNLSHSITSKHPIEEVNDCLENLYRRTGNPVRFIIEPGAS
ncbi:MAG TPA: zinc-binding dehydrogenase [Leptospiraceae bacterium]|nr:zinc-binding dehydrogenase [Leptospiraceae bacterium]